MTPSTTKTARTVPAEETPSPKNSALAPDTVSPFWGWVSTARGAPAGRSSSSAVTTTEAVAMSGDVSRIVAPSSDLSASCPATTVMRWPVSQLLGVNRTMAGDTLIEASLR